MEPRVDVKDKKKKHHLNIVDWCVLAGIFVVIFSVSSPSITLAREEQKVSDMVGRLQTMRSYILLYCAEHDGLMPGQKRKGQPVTFETFTAAICDYQPRGFARLKAIPENPYIIDPQLGSRVFCVNDVHARPTGQEGVGWWFNAATGDFYACDSKFHTRY